MNRRLLIAGLVLATAALIGRQWQRQLVGQWLAAAQAAERWVDYHGVQQVRFDGGSTRVTVRHRAPEQTRYEYLGPSFAGLVVLELGGKTYRLDPQLDQVVASPSADSLPPSLAGLGARLGTTARIAGRPAQWVHLSGRGWRRHLAVDRDTGVVLATVATRADGATVESRFVEFALGDGGSDGFEPPDGAVERDRPRSLAELREALGLPLEEPTWLPAGYRLVTTVLCDCACGCGGCTAQLLYSDGIGSLSVFLGGDSCPDCIGSATACEACGVLDACVTADAGALPVAARLDGLPRIMVVGNLPAGTLARIADSVPRH